MSILIKAPIDSPLFADTPVALVNDDKISFSDFTKNLEMVHKNLTGEERIGRRKSFSELLNRLIAIKLITQEARNIGLDQQPDIKEIMAADVQAQLKSQLFAIYLKDIKGDEKEAEKIYREFNREAKITQLEFKEEDDAKKFEQAVHGGKSFDDLAGKAVKDDTAVLSKENNYTKLSAMAPKNSQIISNMKIGAVSPVIAVPARFIIFRLDDLRVADDPAKKDEARAMALVNAQNRELEKRKLALFKKYMKQDTKRIKSLDFESKNPGFAKLLNDNRVLVYVKGDKPITVADLAVVMGNKFTHGIDRAIKEKKVNVLKNGVLDSMMAKIVIRKEALEQGLDKTPQFKAKIAQDEEATLFGVFVQKIIKPDIKINREDLKKYYDEHIKEYSYPEMMKVQSIAFKKKGDAQKALEKLRQGMEFKWLTENAEGLVDPDSKGVLNFEGKLLTTTSMPEGVQKTLAGAKSDEYRFYESPEGYYYVLHVENVVPQRTQTLREAADQVGQAVYDQKFKKLMDDWTNKLRAAADVKVFTVFDK